MHKIFTIAKKKRKKKEYLSNRRRLAKLIMAYLYDGFLIVTGRIN